MKETKNLEEKILIAGTGGQGILFLGKTICLAATEENKNITYIPSYGGEIRGGTAHCFVRVSNREIASPIFDKFTIFFAFNKPSWDRFIKKAQKNALIIANSSLFAVEKKSSLCVIKVPLNNLSLKIGSLKIINMIALGVCLKNKQIFPPDTVVKVLKENFKDKKELLQLNLEAFKAGLNYG